VNGSSSRYSTRCSTGSIKRKNYKRVFSDELGTSHVSPGDDSSSDTSNSDQDDPDRHQSPPSRTRLSNTTKGSSNTRRVIDSESDHSVSDSSLLKSRPVKNGGHESSDDSEQASNGSSDSDSDKSSSSGTEAEKSDSDTEEYSTDEVMTRTTRSTTGRGSRQQQARQRPQTGRSHRSGASGGYSTRNRGQRTVVYHEDSDDNNSATEELTTVSSRGRVRKLTPRARAIFS
jgi:bromodomain and WD repeat domain-containing protein 1/3